MHAAYKSDNASWAEATPFGRLEFGVTNPDAIASFRVGRDHWVDLSLIEAAATAPTADPADTTATGSAPEADAP